MNIVTWLVCAFYAYWLLGLAFALWFAFKGVNKVDAAMTHSPWTVRLLLIPGSAALWIVLLKKCLKKG